MRETAITTAHTAVSEYWSYQGQYPEVLRMSSATLRQIGIEGGIWDPDGDDPEPDWTKPGSLLFNIEVIIDETKPYGDVCPGDFEPRTNAEKLVVSIRAIPIESIRSHIDQVRASGVLGNTEGNNP